MKKLFFLILFLMSQASIASTTYIKGVTYFGNAWPINFWNSDLRNVDEDFKNIKKDGFNSIFLVVPWGEFQPDTEKLKFNENSYSRLNKVCRQAKKNDLKLFMRVSYLWDMHPEVKMPTYERFGKLFNHPETQDAWSKYLKKISDMTNDCATGVFLSWEDYWHVIDKIRHATTIEERAYLSNYYGFNDWVKEKIQQGANSHQYSKFLHNGQYIYPQKSTVDFQFVYEWFDDQLVNQLLPRVAQYFKSASIEARVDDDPIFEGEKIVSWYSHKKTFDIKSSEFIFTYWAPAMGAENKGEKDTAASVLKRFSWINNKVAEASSNKIVIAQLLFEDNTPSAAKNAVIKEGEKKKFFELIASPLVSQTQGYALWGGRDYDANMVFNPSFDVGIKGWALNARDTKKISHLENSSYLTLKAGEDISQKILSIFNHFKGASNKTYLRLSGVGEALLEISYAGSKILYETSVDYKKYNFNFPVADGDSTLRIKVLRGAFGVENVNLYPFTTVANFRNVFNEPRARASDILKLNKNIDDGAGLPNRITASDQTVSSMQGLYPAEVKGENSSTWASKNVKVKMHATGNRLLLRGYLSDNLVRDNCDVNIFVNDKEIARENIKKSGDFNIDVELPEKYANEVVGINVTSSCAVKKGKDKRDLAYIFKEISLK